MDEWFVPRVTAAEGSWAVSFVYPSQMTNWHHPLDGLQLDQLEFRDIVFLMQAGRSLWASRNSAAVLHRCLLNVVLS